MSRGLKALKRIKTFMELNAKHWKQDVGYIEEELKEHEKYKLTEKELGISLNVLIEIIKTRKFWIIENDKVRRFYFDYVRWYNKTLKGYITCGDTTIYDCTVNIKDYGKKQTGGWALTKEELL